MDTRPTRRGFSLGGIAAGVAAAAPQPLGASRRAKSAEATPEGNDERTAHLKGAFGTLALMYLAGYGDVLGKLLVALQAKHPELDAQRLVAVFRVLVTGDFAAIDSAARRYGYAVDLVCQPLIVLGRAGLLPPLHDHVLQRLGAKFRSDFTASAAVALAAGDEWDHAARILARARETGAGIAIDPRTEDRLWKYAYLHRRVDTAMPLLSEMPFSPEFPELIAYRKWRLRAGQIRAGLPGERVPIIEDGQTLGYSEAAAMQAVALGDDPAAADYVASLRRVIKAPTVRVALAERGFALSVTNVPQTFVTAEMQIAAHRKDITRVKALARTPLEKVIVDPPTVAIDALLDEGDWRAAAAVAQEHDPRKQTPRSPIDDGREERYARLYTHIAIAAAREGDDAAAAALATDTRPAGHATDDAGLGAFAGLQVLLALVAGGRLPRKYLNVMVPAFINPDDRDST